jgi:hypothetical protein
MARQTTWLGVGVVALAAALSWLIAREAQSGAACPARVGEERHSPAPTIEGQR